ncbi:MAG: cytochrome c biogenesis protein CcdA, partial [Pontimonas sp.]|nr:cytochrome c biogenesis protein CcdA [Pontimonas sp.]
MSSIGELVFSGPLLLALPIALAAGFVAFASPCVLPLVPGYLGYVSGFTGSS